MKSDQWKIAFYWFLPGVLLGALVMWMYTGTGTNTPRVADIVPHVEAENSENGTVVRTVAVSDQPAGHAIVVEHVELSGTSWIAVRELDDAGNFGNILGAARRDAGSHDRVVVDLLRATEPNHHYAVVLYTDDGDKMFDSKKDTQITNPDNTPLMSQLRALVPVGPSGQ